MKSFDWNEYKIVRIGDMFKPEIVANKITRDISESRFSEDKYWYNLTNKITDKEVNYYNIV